MNTVVLIILVLLLFGGIGAGPWWGYNRGSSYGYWPSGVLGLLFVILLILLLMGRL